MTLIRLAILALYVTVIGCAPSDSLPTDQEVERQFEEHRASLEAIIAASSRNDPVEMVRYLELIGPTSRMGTIHGPHRHFIILHENFDGLKGVAFLDSPPSDALLLQNLSKAPEDEMMYFRKLEDNWYIAQLRSHKQK